ncbi:MAG: universal stress protein [Deltaproteobacteria bacterium]|nr:universal stress protein [Deltaproteobacteria bacterium]
MFRKILAANDGSEGARKALIAAIDLAKKYRAELHSISVEEHLPHYAASLGEVLEAQSEANDYFKKKNEEAMALALKEGLSLHTHVLAGHEVGTIIQFAKDNHFDLLVIGFMGHSKIFGRIWGSTSHNLTRLSPCTVLVVK